MIANLLISNQQAESLPESNAIASTPDRTEFYICVETASDLEISEQLIEIEPKIKGLLSSHSVIHLITISE